MSAAVASGQHNGRAIGQWADEQSEDLAEQPGRGRRPLPSEAAASPPWQGLAVDGKAVRGARAHRRGVQLVAAVRYALITLFRSLGWTSIAHALRHDGAKVERALQLIGAAPLRL